MRKIFISVVATTLFVFSFAGAALCAETKFTVSFEGPGGHSNHAYGRVSALHTAGRVVTALNDTKTAAKYEVVELSGGNSVNSIAFNGKIIINVSGSESQIAEFEKALAATVTKGVESENKFRKVEPGTVDKTGRRMDVRANIAKN